jgi:hypothetical protein
MSYIIHFFMFFIKILFINQDLFHYFLFLFYFCNLTFYLEKMVGFAHKEKKEENIYKVSIF